jgi:nucleoside-diphosphate-sugar epimerase
LAETRVWNPADPDSVRSALEGTDAIIYLVGVNYWQFELHPTLMRATLRGAIEAGVKRIVLCATVYPYGVPLTTPVREDHPRDPQTFKGQMRKEQEDILLAAHERGEIQVSIVRCPDLYGPHMEKSFLTSAFESAPLGKTAQLVGPIDTPHEFAFIPDVAETIVRVLDEPRAFGRAWNYAGPEVTSQRQLVEKIYAACGRKAKFMVATRWMLRAFGLFSPMMRELVEMNYLQTTPVILDDSALGALLGSLPKTSYDEGIRRTLAA